jgi:hypothetical protein
MRWTVTLGLTLLLIGCASASIAQEERNVTIEASWGMPSLGIMVDAKQQVVHVNKNSSVEKAGLQPGDILLDIQPAVDAPGVEKKIVPFTDAQAVRALIESTIVLESLAESSVANQQEGEKPDMDRDGKGEANSLEGEAPPKATIPFKVRIKRGDKILELEVTPGFSSLWTPGEPTPTPAPTDFQYF